MWFYERERANGGAGGEAFRSIFNGSGLDAASRLAREAVQNSVDAARLGAQAAVLMEMKAFSGGQLEEFWEAAGLEQVAARVEHLRLHETNALRARPDPLRVLYIHDTGTTGLSGDPTSPSSKLRKLLMEIGGSQKIESDEHSGGSYGFGKAVYSASSRIAVIFAYSRTVDQNDEPISVLMGCAYHNGHVFDGKPTNGRAFFGEEVKLENDIRHDPFLNEEADAIAEKLGMQRKLGEIGTTIAVVDCVLDMNDIRRGIEKSWWPKMRIENFKVRMLDENGKKLFPQPMKDPELLPFIKAIEVALGRTDPQSGISKLQKSFHRVGDDLKVGHLGLFVRDPEDEYDEDSDQPDLRDKIALIRSPGMVVDYYGKGQVNHPPVAGVFIADDDLDAILRRAEPPAHDRWDPNADRLNRDKAEPEIVAEVLKRIWGQLRSFQRSARPPEDKSGGRLLELERALARMLGTSGRSVPSGEGQGPTPISLQPKVQVEAVGDELKVTGKVVIKLKDDQTEALPVVVGMKLSAVDETGRHIDDIKLDADFGDTDSTFTEGLGWEVALDPGQTIAIAIESSPYDPEWTVDFVPSVQPKSE